MSERGAKGRGKKEMFYALNLFDLKASTETIGRKGL